MSKPTRAAWWSSVTKCEDIAAGHEASPDVACRRRRAASVRWSSSGGSPAAPDAQRQAAPLNRISPTQTVAALDIVSDRLAAGANTKDVANSRFAIKSWDEKPYGEGQGLPKPTRAAVTKTFAGDIAGEGHVEDLMMYRSDGSATFVGLERVVGRVAGRAGSFALQRTGAFENGE